MPAPFSTLQQRQPFAGKLNQAPKGGDGQRLRRKMRRFGQGFGKRALRCRVAVAFVALQFASNARQNGGPRCRILCRIFCRFWFVLGRRGFGFGRWFGRGHRRGHRRHRQRHRLHRRHSRQRHNRHRRLRHITTINGDRKRLASRHSNRISRPWALVSARRPPLAHFDFASGHPNAAHNAACGADSHDHPSKIGPGCRALVEVGGKADNVAVFVQFERIGAPNRKGRDVNTSCSGHANPPQRVGFADYRAILQVQIGGCGLVAGGTGHKSVARNRRQRGKEGWGLRSAQVR
ncbi:MAG: hypothetical protein EBR34_15325 [Sphingomonadaceae bacterium]|nr:hypothetical protein [Sphingomonadaceae bacterium]